MAGDTLIPLLDGRIVPISELENEKEFWVYSCTKEGRVVPGIGHSARVTKTVSEIYRITLDNWEIIECTNNHPFMKLDGMFVRADELKVGDDLMPVHKKLDRSNPSIAKIEVVELDKPIEVWDITVEEHHNFALEVGVFVHNSHIANLVTGLFMQHCPELVKAGMVYKLDAPFYRVTDKKGKVSYFYHDQKDQIDFSTCKVDKLKGLGSYNDKETKEFLMSPESRRLIKLEYNEDHQVEIDDAVTLLFSAAKRKQLMIDSGIFVEGQIK